MLVAAAAYNLKKLLKYKFKPIQEVQKKIENCINDAFDSILSRFGQQYAIKSLPWF